MGLWEKIFPSKVSFVNSIHEELVTKFPNKDEKDLIILACLSGLAARVAYADLKLHPEERNIIKESLAQWSDYTSDEIEEVSDLAIKHTKDLCGLENHLYTESLQEFLSVEQRKKVLDCLFSIAISDGGVSTIETNEINNISKGLALSHSDYVEAKVKVQSGLSAIKNS